MSFSCGQDGGHGKRVAVFNDGLPDGESDSLQGIGFLSAQQRGIANRPVVHHVKERLGRREMPYLRNTSDRNIYKHGCAQRTSRFFVITKPEKWRPGGNNHIEIAIFLDG